MANPLYSLNASDSGILDALGGLAPKPSRLDRRREEPTLAGGLHDVDRASDTDIAQRLCDVPLPPDFLNRMRDAVDRA